MSPSQIRIDTKKREELLSSTQKTQKQQDALPDKVCCLQDQPQDPQTKAPRLMARGLWIRVFVVVVRCVSRGSLLSLQSIDTDTRDISILYKTSNTSRKTRKSFSVHNNQLYAATKVYCRVEYVATNTRVKICGEIYFLNLRRKSSALHANRCFQQSRKKPFSWKIDTQQYTVVANKFKKTPRKSHGNSFFLKAT
jgi:hypothetical protein